ncbi:MAG TPA: hypothetical protein ENH91_08320 [Leeuwenhoekiella sp.]|nr:hypothetical protein [Leeuwenhoekiella sp.]
MPWNLLIFPLVGGYYILTRSHRFKFIQQRLDRQRLIFESVLIGSFTCALAVSIRLIFFYYYPSLIEKIYINLPFKEPYTITACATLALSIILTEVGNLIFVKNKYAIKAIKSVGNECELLFETSFSKSKLLLFSLSNDKFYIGWVVELPIPSISSHVRIIPVISGYRNEEKKLEFTTEYLNVYTEMMQKVKSVDVKEFKTDIVIDVQQIITVSFYDFQLSNNLMNAGKET